MSVWDKILKHQKSLIFPENKFVWLLSLKRDEQSEISESDFEYVSSCQNQQTFKRLSRTQMKILNKIYEKYQKRDYR